MSCVIRDQPQARKQPSASRARAAGESRLQHHDVPTSRAARCCSPEESRSVLNTIFLLPCGFVVFLLSWIVQLFRDLVRNAAFFLYVVKNLLNELWYPEKTTATNLVQTSEKDRAVGIQGLPIPLTSDQSEVDASAVDRNKKWFLSDESFPEATVAERTRFLNARNGDVVAASAMLRNYLNWRAQFDANSTNDKALGRSGSLPSAEEDPDWSRACRMASSVLSSTGTSTLPTIPPCILFMPDKDNANTTHSTGEESSLHTIDGKRVLQHLPARIDLSFADTQVYATALSLYIDCCVSRHSMEKICVVIDTRPGKGWKNIPAPKLVPFIKHAAKLLNDLHPERLSRCILFPVPSVAKLLWNTIKPWLDVETANKICILSGSANVKSPVPKEMYSYFQPGVVEWMEQKRLSSFEDGSTKRKLQDKLQAQAALSTCMR